MCGIAPLAFIWILDASVSCGRRSRILFGDLLFRPRTPFSRVAVQFGFSSVWVSSSWAASAFWVRRESAVCTRTGRCAPAGRPLPAKPRRLERSRVRSNALGFFLSGRRARSPRAQRFLGAGWGGCDPPGTRGFARDRGTLTRTGVPAWDARTCAAPGAPVPPRRCRRTERSLGSKAARPRGGGGPARPAVTRHRACRYKARPARPGAQLRGRPGPTRCFLLDLTF